MVMKEAIYTELKIELISYGDENVPKIKEEPGAEVAIVETPVEVQPPLPALLEEAATEVQSGPSPTNSPPSNGIKKITRGPEALT